MRGVLIIRPFWSDIPDCNKLNEISIVDMTQWNLICKYLTSRWVKTNTFNTRGVELTSYKVIANA